MKIQDGNIDSYIVKKFKLFLMYEIANLLETSPVLFALMTGLTMFFLVLILLGIYNFAYYTVSLANMAFLYCLPRHYEYDFPFALWGTVL